MNLHFARVSEAMVSEAVTSMLGQDSSNPFGLKIEAVVSLSSKKYSCVFCGKRCRDFCRLQDHIRIHTGEKPHQCGHCKKSFRTREEVRVHNRTHTGERPYQCPQCGIRFNQANARAKHMTVFHREGKDVNMNYFQCTTCGEKFYRKSDLAKHQRKHEDGTIIGYSRVMKEPTEDGVQKTLPSMKKVSKYFQCTGCSRFFSLERHFREHTCIASPAESSSLQCPACGKSYKQQAHLTQHIMKSKCRETAASSLQGPVKKERIGAPAPPKTAAKKPVRVPKYECNLCGRKLHRETELDMHVRSVHYNLKEFACSLCSRQFGWKSAWKKHMKVVHKSF